MEAIKIDNVDDLENLLANQVFVVKSAKFEGESLVDTNYQFAKGLTDNATPMEQVSMYLGGKRSPTINGNALLSMMLGAATCFGPGNHASVPAHLSRDRLMISRAERDRRKKLKKIAARDRKRNRK